MEKIDTSPEEEAVKDEAREFMSGIVPSVPDEAATAEGDGTEIVEKWRSIYSSDSDDKAAQFWAAYDPETTSIWTMIYDEADENENVDDTIDIVANFMGQSGMASIKNECFGVVHVLDSLEIEGLWLFNGQDPEPMFGANEETSWYSWSRLGPEATDLVKGAVEKFLLPKDGKMNDKAIKDTKSF